MDIQRLRNLTTGRLHTDMAHVYKDIEYLVGADGALPNVRRALEPYLREKAPDARLWNGEFDTSHTGEIDIPPMDEAAKAAFWERFSSQK